MQLGQVTTRCLHISAPLNAAEVKEKPKYTRHTTVRHTLFFYSILSVHYVDRANILLIAKKKCLKNSVHHHVLDR